jgi:hypothetical protein
VLQLRVLHQRPRKRARYAAWAPTLEHGRTAQWWPLTLTSAADRPRSLVAVCNNEDGDYVDNMHEKWFYNYRLLESHHG